ncbi:transcript variant X1 [Nothobranchius furzeri]|uniref:Transcript variant X1 n=1 Tax=Nothobranchius furzeri TaxID=105023 RepID=A0A9D2Y2E2_NOTFU|nr:transcript variant X1 [Nothobranchius furzeri]
MSLDSHHGKWTISSSDDEDELLPPSGTTGASSRQTAEISHSSPPSASPVTLKAEAARTPVSSRSVGSEARRTATKNQINPVRYKTSPSLAGKRKNEVSEGTGWALSDSDEDDGAVKQNNQANLPKRAPLKPETKKLKAESERPPSPHGRQYYIDESEDFFESCTPRLDDTYRFYLNKVTGLDREYNSGALHIRDLLSPLFGTLKESVQFNYCFDIAWMVKQFPPEFRDRPVLIIHGDKREAKARLLQQAQPFPHVRFCQAKLDIAFGTHHTKMMLLWYEEGFRVIILTSNLIRADWYQKTQGMWMSPLFPRLPEGSRPSAGESPTFFKRDLLEYLASYRAPELEEWIQRIKEHDLSETRVYLVASTPGRYVGPDMERWGHLRLRKLLHEHTNPIPGEERWPVIGQFSSIGSMGADKTKWLAGEFQRTLTTLGKSSLHPSPPIHLLYPSVEDVRLSLEGFPAGGSLPYSIQTAQKQLWLHSYFHSSASRNPASTLYPPHLRTRRVSPVFTQRSSPISVLSWPSSIGPSALRSVSWTVCPPCFHSSHLLCAWPAQPDMKTFPIDETPFPVSSSTSGFPVPFDLPPTSYSPKDQPWIWNISYSQEPDTHGNIWVPS